MASKQYTDEFKAEAVKQVIERGFALYTSLILSQFAPPAVGSCCECIRPSSAKTFGITVSGGRCWIPWARIWSAVPRNAMALKCSSAPFLRNR